MIDLGNRQITTDGTVMLSTAAAVEALYAGDDLSSCVVESSQDVDLYLRSLRLLDMDLPALVTEQSKLPQIDWSGSWSTPQPWADMDVLEHCAALCGSETEVQRVCEEYLLFEERGMIPVLRHLMYMVQHLRSQNIVWGVGRGSSVSSYVLFLIGINRIDPLKFNLDVSEFLK